MPGLIQLAHSAFHPLAHRFELGQHRAKFTGHDTHDRGAFAHPIFHIGIQILTKIGIAAPGQITQCGVGIDAVKCPVIIQALGHRFFDSRGKLADWQVHHRRHKARHHRDHIVLKSRIIEFFKLSRIPVPGPERRRVRQGSTILPKGEGQKNIA